MLSGVIESESLSMLNLRMLGVVSGRGFSLVCFTK